MPKRLFFKKKKKELQEIMYTFHKLWKDQITLVKVNFLISLTLCSYYLLFFFFFMRKYMVWWISRNIYSFFRLNEMEFEFETESPNAMNVFIGKQGSNINLLLEQLHKVSWRRSIRQKKKLFYSYQALPHQVIMLPQWLIILLYWN